MATKPEAVKPEADEPAKKPPKSKKKRLLIGLVVLVVLALAGAGAWFYLSQPGAPADGEEVVVEDVEPKGPPTFFPLDNMVVNLADPGGDKVAQIGITLELADSKAAEQVKMYLPSIRSGILLLISQRTAEELLQIAGKEKLAADILREASRPFADTGSVSKKKTLNPGTVKKKSPDPAVNDEALIRSVLFSSFIVQ